jgi:hypothetical protein
MKRVSPRLVLGATTVLIISGALLALALGGGGQPPKPYTPLDIASGKAPVGGEIIVVGEVVSQADGMLVLRPAGASSPTVTVDMTAKSSRVRFGEGVHIAARGVVTSSGDVVDASVIGPSPPSKYESSTRSK